MFAGSISAACEEQIPRGFAAAEMTMASCRAVRACLARSLRRNPRGLLRTQLHPRGRGRTYQRMPNVTGTNTRSEPCVVNMRE